MESIFHSLSDDPKGRCYPQGPLERTTQLSASRVLVLLEPSWM